MFHNDGPYSGNVTRRKVADVVPIDRAPIGAGEQCACKKSAVPCDGEPIFANVSHIPRPCDVCGPPAPAPVPPPAPAPAPPRVVALAPPPTAVFAPLASRRTGAGAAFVDDVQSVFRDHWLAIALTGAGLTVAVIAMTAHDASAAEGAEEGDEDDDDDEEDDDE